uniref:Uncharacterized protein n=1 Tax=Anguilla anguilla TaxID=7936 RepID=A0A0E9S9Z6_ANGAN
MPDKTLNEIYLLYLNYTSHYITDIK